MFEHNLLLGRDFVEQMTKKLNDNLTSPADFKAKHIAFMKIFKEPTFA